MDFNEYIQNTTNQLDALKSDLQSLRDSWVYLTVGIIIILCTISIIYVVIHNYTTNKRLTDLENRMTKMEKGRTSKKIKIWKLKSKPNSSVEKSPIDNDNIQHGSYVYSSMKSHIINPLLMLMITNECSERTKNAFFELPYVASLSDKLAKIIDVIHPLSLFTVPYGHVYVATGIKQNTLLYHDAGFMGEMMYIGIHNPFEPLMTAVHIAGLQSVLTTTKNAQLLAEYHNLRYLTRNYSDMCDENGEYQPVDDFCILYLHHNIDTEGSELAINSKREFEKTIMRLLRNVSSREHRFYFNEQEFKQVRYSAIRSKKKGASDILEFYDYTEFMRMVRDYVDVLHEKRNRLIIIIDHINDFEVNETCNNVVYDIHTRCGITKDAPRDCTTCNMGCHLRLIPPDEFINELSKIAADTGVTFIIGVSGDEPIPDKLTNVEVIANDIMLPHKVIEE